MPIDLTTLATTTVTLFLVPYAKVGLEKLSETIGDEFGKKTAKYASDLTNKIWNRVKSAFSASEEQSILEVFAKNPDEMEAMLIKALKEKLGEDENFAKALSDLVNQPGPDGATTGAQIMNAGIAGIADLRNANISNARNLNIAGVMIDKSSKEKDS